jgi:hypothetical protein
MSHAALFVTLSLALGARPVVLLSPEDRTSILGPVIQSLQAQLSDLPVELKVVPVPRLEGSLGAQMRVARQMAGPQGLAVVWLEINPGDPVFVYVSDPQRNRVLARSVDWDGAMGHLEPVGLIVRSSVQALLDGQVIGFEANPTVAKDKPPPLPRPPRIPLHLGVTAAYTPSFMASTPQVLHGFDAGIYGAWSDFVYLALRYRVYPSFLVWGTDNYSVAQISRHPISVVLGGRYPLGRLRIGAELAATFDVVDIENQKASVWIAPAASNEQVVFTLDPAVLLDVQIIDMLSAYAACGVDVPVGERRYLIYGPAGKAAVLTPWEVQPRVIIGLRFQIL